jgi:hypothetical protein
MSLLSTDITKVKRLSLKDVKLPDPAPRSEPITPTHIEKPLRDEEIAYKELVDDYPLIERLVIAFDTLAKEDPGRYSSLYHVNPATNRITSSVKNSTPLQEPEILHKGIGSLSDIASRIIEEANSYSKDEIVDRLMRDTKVARERAENGFRLMLEAGVIEQTINPEFYYLVGSTPF